ncbi:PREDICTED: uncharacterized protein LOC108781402 [Cyphomyrmex costatus]|uniref:uncharacterized protein LOC108781402 n=1 Tax=Cyphomyrmex costatus TaxID=456900 RepID=UPI0008521E84|nr:PREDICTED: uncharacterized protein LOC108781402 [Cyphomyrmex costatus]
MAAEVIEKRWTSLRDMFSREKRKQQLPPSGSGYKPTKEWELYKTMLFLNTYIEHRRTKTSLSLKIGQSSCSTQSEIEKNNSLSSCKHDVISINDETVNCNENYSDDSLGKYMADENEAPIIDSNILKIPCNTLNNNSIDSFSPSRSISSKIQSVKRPVLQNIAKNISELDEFAKRRKTKDNLLEKELIQASSTISATMNNVSSFICSQNKNENGYMLAIEEALKYVPDTHKTQCLIEVLQQTQPLRSGSVSACCYWYILLDHPIAASAHRSAPHS